MQTMSQNPDEESMLLETQSTVQPTNRKPVLAIAAAVATTALLSIGALYSTNNSIVNSATDLAATFSFGNAKLGVFCGDTETAMRNGNDLYSESGQYRLAFQSDGNLVLYDGGSAIWATGTSNNADKVGLYNDGHFIATKNGQAKWTTNRYGYPKTFLSVQNDGNIVEYDWTNLNAVWASNTARNSRRGNVDINVVRKQCYTNSPTPAPIADPTQQPTAKPTFKPSAQPSPGPTKWTALYADAERPLLKGNKFRLNDWGENKITTLARGGGISYKDQKSALSGIKIESFDGYSGSSQLYYNW